MRFNPRAQVDQSQFEDRPGRGSTGGTGIRLPIPRGGGKITVGSIVVLALVFVANQLLSGTGGDGADTTSCRTGADANRSDTCAVALFTESVQDYWSRALPDQMKIEYRPIKTVAFSGLTDSGCGRAASAMGPFYCPNDQTVYLDSTFFDQMLTGELGATGGTFAIGYVVAHEYGHHIEDQLGVLARMRTHQGPDSDSVRAELMADCLGGMWAKGAQQTTDHAGAAIIEDLTQDDIARAINAAQAVGDDRIQQRSSGRVDPEAWTHGSAAQRAHWFNVGLKYGSLQACETFDTGAL